MNFVVLETLSLKFFSLAAISLLLLEITLYLLFKSKVNINHYMSLY